MSRTVRRALPAHIIALVALFALFWAFSAPTQPNAALARTMPPRWIVDDHGDDFASATRISVGDWAEGELAPITDVGDFFRFEAERGAYDVDLRLSADVIITLYSNDGRLLASDEFDYESRPYICGYNSEQTAETGWSLPSSGTYYVGIERGGDFGDYAFLITMTPTEAVPTPTLAPGPPTFTPTPGGVPPLRAYGAYRHSPPPPCRCRQTRPRRLQRPRIRPRRCDSPPLTGASRSSPTATATSKYTR